MKHLEPLGSRRRVYVMKGNGLGASLKSLSKRLGSVIRNLSGKAYKRGVPIVKQVLRDMGPILANTVANKIANEASKRGAPDVVSNAVAQAGQKGAQALDKQSNDSRKKLSVNDKKASDFLNSQAQNVLARILAGNGINTLGDGINTLGGGINTLGGNSLLDKQAPSTF